MLTQEELTIINRLKALSKGAKKGPWSKGGTVNKKDRQNCLRSWSC